MAHMMGAMMHTFTSTSRADAPTPSRWPGLSLSNSQKLKRFANRLRTVNAMQNHSGNDATSASGSSVAAGCTTTFTNRIMVTAMPMTNSVWNRVDSPSDAGGSKSPRRQSA